MRTLHAAEVHKHPNHDTRQFFVGLSLAILLMLASAILTLAYLGYVDMPSASTQSVATPASVGVSVEATPAGGFWKYRGEWVDENASTPSRRPQTDTRVPATTRQVP